MMRITTSSPETWPARLLLPFFLFLILATYSHTLYSPLVLDDTASFVEMREVYINDFSCDSLKQIAGSRFGMARFLPMLSFAVDHRLNPGSIVQFHLTNIVIHLLTTLALYAFLTGIMRFDASQRMLRLTSPAHFCLFVAVLWALHPVQTNAVTYLVQRMASMMAMFYLAALACYVFARASHTVARRCVLYGAAACMALAAFLSKENAVTLPFAILLIEFIFLAPAMAARLRRAMTWPRLLLAVLLLLLLTPFVLGFLDNIMASYQTRHFTLLERLLTEPRIIVFYLSLLALPLPSRLNLDHDFTLSTSLLSPPTTLVAVVLLFVLLLAAVRLRHREPLVAFGVLWFFLQLFVESTIIPLELIFEHRLYLPSIGFILLVVAGVDRAFAFWGRYKITRPGRMAFLCLIILVCVSSLLTSTRNHTWRDSLSIYGDSLRKSPNKPRALVNYGLALFHAKEYAEALPLFEQAITIGRPGEEEYVKATNNILAILISHKEYEEAVTTGMDYLLAMPPNANGAGFAKFMFSLGYSYYKLSRFEEALGAFYRGIVQQNADQEQFLQAIWDVYESALSSQEGDTLENDRLEREVSLNVAAFMLRFKLYDYTRRFLDVTLALDPGNLEAKAMEENLLLEINANEMAMRSADITQNVAFQQNRRFRWTMEVATFLLRHRPSLLSHLAIPLLNVAQELEPANPFVAVRMIEYHMAMNDPENALATTEKALKQHDDFVPLLELAGTIYLGRDDQQRAALVYRRLLAIYPGHPQRREYEATILKNRPTQSSTAEEAAQVSPPTSQSW